MTTDSSNDAFTLRRRPAFERFLDIGFRQLTLALASVVALLLLGIFLTIAEGAHEAIATFGARFLVSSAWDPVNNQYGALVAIYGTMVSSLLALAIAVPLGVGTAIFITEDLIPTGLRSAIGLMVELLAAIPSVVLGLWAIFVMEPAIRPALQLLHRLLGWTPFFDTVPQGPGMAPAILILVVMILPIITAISRDALNQVPLELRQAAYGIGSTRWGAIFNIILPAAISAIVGGVMLSLGRAMGETMAVTMIIGNSLNFSFSLLAPGNTISAMLANQFGEASGIQVSALMYAALVLMVLTFAVNVLAQLLVRRLSLRY
ncbi:phosphate ABC transporter permease subunit PstC [Synechococcus sp. CCY9201]|jgi:phosphate transport system permease protein|uniref:phosphate ABC transporter permease subunit PstC n=1 Tax=unclassified Synechococcus TaxID=2626047 RepID=UPI0018CC99A5|nr:MULTISPECIES: phosphate ABC transporter permease subunit PstC [unclassified Synechococcus]MEA5424457.1 phosphate ABC transporter permease subunit PstC [Synechococcus sp. CCY9202]MEA5475012.1 phosphate ABC transporter permease subunit PstC [Synechococcus sp. CCY9201]QPN59558.1 phosphate ABC transporter permease subunit PstC [Synechococcus sp. CBW1002]